LSTNFRDVTPERPNKPDKPDRPDRRDRPNQPDKPEMESNNLQQHRLIWTSSKTNKPFPLRVNFSWTLVGNIVYAGCQWGMLTVLAKIGTTEMVGQFALGLAITAPVFMFS